MGEGNKMNGFLNRKVQTNINLLLIITLSLVTGYFILTQNFIFFIITILCALAIIAVRNSFWAIIFVIIMHFWFGSIEAGVYPRILSIFYLILVATPIIIFKKIKYGIVFLDPKTKIILWISLSMFIWQIFINQIVHSYEMNQIIVTTAKVLAPILMAIIIYILIETKNQFENYIYILVVAISVSAFIGILQFFDIPWAWKIREIQGEVIAKPEPAGLSLYSLLFSYHLSLAIPLTFSLIINKKIALKKRQLLLLALLVLIFALLATKVRSAIIGSLIGILFIILIAKNYKNGMVGIIILSILIYVFSVTYPPVFKEISTFSDQSASARIPLFLTALRIAKDHPLFGIGAGRYSEIAESYYYQVSHMSGAETVLRTSSHNQFLNTLDYFGIFGLFLLLFFYYKLIKGLILLNRNVSNDYFSYISCGLIGTHISYIIHSSFHNTGPFLSDPYAWFFVGITFVIFKYNYLK